MITVKGKDGQVIEGVDKTFAILMAIEEIAKDLPYVMFVSWLGTCVDSYCRVNDLGVEGAEEILDKLRVVAGDIHELMGV